MIRTFKIMNGDDSVKKEIFWFLEEPREGAGRRRLKAKEIKSTLGIQRKDIRKKCFGSRIQDPRNLLENADKQATNLKTLRNIHRKIKGLV